jgi:hypothetical protein
MTAGKYHSVRSKQLLLYLAHPYEPKQNSIEKDLALDKTHPFMDVPFFARIYCSLQVADATDHDYTDHQ